MNLRKPMRIIKAGEALRTGAASGLATRCFARKDAQILALFGCGSQGRTQLEAIVCERNIKKILVYDTNIALGREFQP